MTDNPLHFCIWLQGFVELNQGKLPTEEQWKSICEHLALQFKKITPPVGDDRSTKKMWEDLMKQQIHIGDPTVIC